MREQHLVTYHGDHQLEWVYLNKNTWTCADLARAYQKRWRISHALKYLRIENTKNNTAFYKMCHNFPILAFTEMRFCLSNSSLKCASSDLQLFVAELRDERDLNTKKAHFGKGKKWCFFTVSGIYLCKIASYENNMVRFLINTI